VKTYLPPKFVVERDPNRCIQCQVCVNQCSFDTHYYDVEEILKQEFRKLYPKWLRPYGTHYAY
jgi:Fe-S-cluster-containing dehydrogenase component